MTSLEQADGLGITAETRLRLYTDTRSPKAVPIVMDVARMHLDARVAHESLVLAGELAGEFWEDGEYRKLRSMITEFHLATHFPPGYIELDPALVPSPELKLASQLAAFAVVRARGMVYTAAALPQPRKEYFLQELVGVPPSRVTKAWAFSSALNESDPAAQNQALAAIGELWDDATIEWRTEFVPAIMETPWGRAFVIDQIRQPSTRKLVGWVSLFGEKLRLSPEEFAELLPLTLEFDSHFNTARTAFNGWQLLQTLIIAAGPEGFDVLRDFLQSEENQRAMFRLWSFEKSRHPVHYAATRSPRALPLIVEHIKSRDWSSAGSAIVMRALSGSFLAEVWEEFDEKDREEAVALLLKASRGTPPEVHPDVRLAAVEGITSLMKRRGSIDPRLGAAVESSRSFWQAIPEGGVIESKLEKMESE